MAGALVFVAIAALLGRPMHVPVLATRAFFMVLGVVVGGVATPETVRGMSTWPASIVLICIGMLAVTAASAFYLRTFHRWDLQTAHVCLESPVRCRKVVGYRVRSQIRFAGDHHRADAAAWSCSQ